MEPASAWHLPVLFQEIIHALEPHNGGHYVDGTLGAGGHAAGILQASSPGGMLLGLDVDPQALEIARHILSKFGKRAIIIRASYTSVEQEMKKVGWKKVDGMLLDLGASSMQFDDQDRGFSFQSEAKLDMRFDPSNPTSAYDLVNHLAEDELADLIFTLGEEPAARRIARAIVSARPVTTTTQLARVISSAIRTHGHIHPATRTFQALRISVNDELGSIKQVLPKAVQILKVGGRLAVISFHSLEDRLVKEYFRLEGRDCICPPRQPVCTCGHKASLREINRKPIVPSDEEVSRNPRSRSAKLRVVEKI